MYCTQNKAERLGGDELLSQKQSLFQLKIIYMKLYRKRTKENYKTLLLSASVSHFRRHNSTKPRITASITNNTDLQKVPFDAANLIQFENRTLLQTIKKAGLTHWEPYHRKIIRKGTWNDRSDQQEYIRK